MYSHCTISAIFPVQYEFKNSNSEVSSYLLCRLTKAKNSQLYRRVSFFPKEKQETSFSLIKIMINNNGKKIDFVQLTALR